jgi:hypothetical protein
LRLARILRARSARRNDAAGGSIAQAADCAEPTPGIALARHRDMQIQTGFRTMLLIAAIAGAAGCAEPVESSTAQASTSFHKARANFHGVILSVAPSPMGCFSLEGTSFVADPLGDSNGATISTTNCEWNAAIGECECDVTITIQ